MGLIDGLTFEFDFKNFFFPSEVGPKPITEEHKEKMRAYMKKYRAIRHFLLFIVLAG